MTRSDRTTAVSLRRLSLYNTGSLHKVSLYTNQIKKQLGDDRNTRVSSELMDCKKTRLYCDSSGHSFEMAAVMITTFTSFWLKNIRQYRTCEY